MNRYKISKQLGDGTYGSVLKAINKASGEVVCTQTTIIIIIIILYTTNINKLKCNRSWVLIILIRLQ